MTRPNPIIVVAAITSLLMVGSAAAEPPNKVLGTWRMISAQLDPDGRNLPA